jgi:N6-adenosine-specific RNA methylase IME4
MKKYQIIYADPPWNEQGGGRIKRGADRHYPLMSTMDIMFLPIREIADKNSHLYLWVTNNFLKDGLEVMKAWGFEYKTIITWVKDRMGLGQYYRGRTEHCLFGIRGMLPYKILNGKKQQGETVFFAPRTKHSQKPDEMRTLICKVSDRDGFNKIELFARQKTDGWDVWGNEVKNDVNLSI